MMILYFAFGSNMSRSRLEARTGAVRSLGHVILSDYRHRFSHRGQDDSAKGNIEPALGESVQGILYELGRAQVELLAPYEGGYDEIDVVVCAAKGSDTWKAFSYMAPDDAEDRLPLSSYVEHYVCGMRENQFSNAYIESILRQAQP